MQTFFFNNQVGSGSDRQCLSGRDGTTASTSAGVIGENNPSSEPRGAMVKVGGSASAVVADA